ncbi:UNKNOWN [Stylonychia lemnae]|uniref:Inositol-pentakisphosphate 2-kinase n=1 Tax=Stylonychia lemnae TaxID=5949 RepID=A0A078AUX0_STYLE|nr:UNKNOWN [Stylonychia lemnae]|eukprot:CDW86190.1 UNKNOWN [Stylonychia lemnae]
METQKQKVNISEELNDPDQWTYYNEGNNNIILRYIGSNNILSSKILRIRKNNNVQYYTDPTLFPLEEYNKLFIEKVFMSHPILSKYLQEFEYVTLTQEFLKIIDSRLNDSKECDRSKINSLSTLDLSCPSAMLATNFSSQPEPTDDIKLQKVISFETKPKSGVVEYVPTSVKSYIEQNESELQNFNTKQDMKEKFICNEFTKYHIMQVSRKYKGKLNNLSKYCPRDFFNKESLSKSLRDLIDDRQIYGRLFMNGEELFEVEDDLLYLISDFLLESNIINAVFDFQKFCMHSMEYVLDCYNKVAKYLLDETTREQHFDIIRRIFNNFEFAKNNELANQQCDQNNQEQLWNVIIGYLISATAKDFTIIMRIVDKISQEDIDNKHQSLKNEQILTYKGQQYKVRIGVIDLEGKMYTKLPVYMKEAEEAYLNFVKYQNEN